MSEFTREVHRLIADLPPASAAVVAGMIAAEAAPPSEPLAKAYTEWVAERIDGAHRGIVRQFIAKRAADADVDSLVELATALSKAKKLGAYNRPDYDPDKHPRGQGGRWVHSSTKVRYKPAKPLSDAEEQQKGIPHPSKVPGWSPRALSDEERARYQQAYRQVAAALKPYRGMPEGMAQAHVFYNNNGKVDRFEVNDPEHGEPVRLNPGHSVHHVEVHLKAPGSRDGRSNRDRTASTTFDAVHALTGNPAFAAHLATTDVRGATKQALDALEHRPSEAYTPSTTAFRRMRAGADLLAATAGPVLPPAALAAATTASYVGQFGPQAQQVFGPAVDRAKYRYKGTERKLDPDVKAALKEIKAKYPEPAEAREFLVRGKVQDVPVHEPGRPGDEARMVRVFTPSPLVGYLARQLPDPKLSALQRMSGRTPPSHGVIIDDKGQVSTQMIGHGDDWYLPFDLKNLGALRGGEYLRTRTNGGLTTEDLYTGLMAGARSMTVVSHNGVYTLDFDDTLRGTRRYNSTARAMTERYGQLLDAVKNGDVPASDLDPSIVEGIHDRVGERFDPVRQAPEYRNAVDEEIRSARRNPQASEQMQKEWAAQFIDEQRQKMATKSGAPMRLAQFEQERIVNPLARRIAARENAEAGVQVYTGSEPELQDAALAEYEQNRLGVAGEMLNDDGAWDRFHATKLRELRASTRPMQLDGPGYDFAMRALKEQFPYFVKDVRWTPWDENAPDAGTDHGYVKPHFVRPEAALAGYFDRSILGHSKISADRTRYQNYGVMRRIGLSYEGNPDGPSGSTERHRGYNPPPPDDDKRRDRGREIVPGGGDRPRSATRPEGHEGRDVDLALVKAMLAQTRYGKNVRGFEVNGKAPAGKAVAPDKAVNHATGEKGFWHAPGDVGLHEGFTLLTRPLSDFQDMDDADLHRAAQQLWDLQQEHRVFDLPGRVAYQFEHDGELPPARQLRDDDLADAGLEDNQDHEYELGPEFEPGRSRAQYRATFEQHRGVQFAAGAAGISSLDDPEFTEKLTAHQLDLREDLHNPESDDDPDSTRRLMKAAIRLRQLHRRYHETPEGVSGSGGAAPELGGRGAYGLAGGHSVPTGYQSGRLMPYMGGTHVGARRNAALS